MSGLLNKKTISLQKRLTTLTLIGELATGVTADDVIIQCWYSQSSCSRCNSYRTW